MVCSLFLAVAAMTDDRRDLREMIVIEKVFARLSSNEMILPELCGRWTTRVHKSKGEQ